MLPVSEQELLALLDRGRTLHPIDRTLLAYRSLVSREHDVDPADLPIGVVNLGLAQFYQHAIGPLITAHAPCGTCGETMVGEIGLSPILALAPHEAEHREGIVEGTRFRLPTHRDLAAIALLPEADRRVSALFERCCDDSRTTGLVARVEAAMEQLDPLADIEVSITCDACGQASTLCLDIGALVWDRLVAAGRTLIGEIHRLAAAYGWSESEIVALGADRRAAYLEWIVA